MLLDRESSRRDDLEAAGYLLLSFIKPKSPVFRRTDGIATHPDVIYEKKVMIPLEVLCDSLPIGRR